MTEPAIRYSVSRRRFLRDTMLTSLGLIAAACAPGSTGGTTGGGGGTKGGEFHGGWPYVLPPQGHWNYFATNAILGGGIYPDLTRSKQRVPLRSAEIPSLLSLPSGCTFHPRCPLSEAGLCDVLIPALLPIPGAREVACHVAVRERTTERTAATA